MSDKRRKQAEVILRDHGYFSGLSMERAVDAMLAFAYADMARERARCANIAEECIKADLVELIVEKIERGEL